MTQPFADSPYVEGHHRTRVGHRFNADKPERLRPDRRHNHDAGLIDVGSNRRRVQPPGESHPAVETMRVNQRFETDAFRTCASHDQPGLRQVFDGLQEEVDALLGSQTSGAEDRVWFAWRWRHLPWWEDANQ